MQAIHTCAWICHLEMRHRATLLLVLRSSMYLGPRVNERGTNNPHEECTHFRAITHTWRVAVGFLLP